MTPRPGLRVRRVDRPDLHPTLLPPRTRLETALLDVCSVTASARTVIHLVTRATQHRLTTAARLQAALARRRRQRWRRLLTDLLTDVRDGSTTPLEVRYLRDVERRHRLPPSERNRPEHEDGRSLHRDVHYLAFGLVAELDGQAAHPPEGAFRDRRRDNRSARQRRWTLRYGWHEVVTEPCEVAAEVAGMLRSLGWAGRPRPCGPGCPAR